MSSEDRLSEMDSTAAALFAAARTFQPTARARRRTLRALGIPVGASFAISSLAYAAKAVSLTARTWAVAAGAAAAIGTGGGVAYWVATAGPAHTPAARAATASGRAREARVKSTTTITSNAAALPEVAEGPDRPAMNGAASQRSSEPPAVRPPGAADASAPPSASRARPAADLAAELRLIARAERRLRAGDPRGALGTLDEHRRAFPGAALSEEAEVLRISALRQAGDVATATRLATRFLDSHPHSPLVSRVRSLLGAPASQDPQGELP